MPRPCAVESHARRYQKAPELSEMPRPCAVESDARRYQKAPELSRCHGLAPWSLTLAATKKPRNSQDRGRERRLVSLPLPPNRTGGFPASGSPVSGSPRRGLMRVQGRQREHSMHFDEHQHPFGQSDGLTAGVPVCLAHLGTRTGVAVIVLRYSNPPSCTPLLHLRYETSSLLWVL